MSTVTAPDAKRLSVKPWGIEAAHQRNCDLLLQSVEGCRLRSAIRPNKEIIDRDPQTREQIVRDASAKVIEGLPANIPGMQIHVNPAKCAYRIVDPLHDDEAMCERIQQALERQTSVRTGSKLRGVEGRSGTVDRDRMKTLVREMCNLVAAGEAKVVQGICPGTEEVDGLPGDYLLDPSNMGLYHRPRYEKDEQDWVETLNRLK